MSTKTTFKRIALVAVAAMGFGLMTAIPSQAVAQADSLTGAAASSVTLANGSTGDAKTDLVFSYIADGTTAMGISSQVLSSPLTSSVIALSYVKTTGSTSANTTYTDGASVGPVTSANTRTTAYITASFHPDAAGTYVIRFTPTGGTNNTPITWTVTAVAPTYNHSTVGLAAANSGTLTDGVVSAPATPSIDLANIGTVQVDQYASTDSATPALTSITQAVTVSISKGLVGLNSGNYYTAAPSLTVAAGGAASQTFKVYTNGSVGSASLTVSVGGTLVSTKTVIFQGTAVALAISAPSVTIANSGAGTSAKTVQTVVKYLDAAGNTATNSPAVTYTSATAASAGVSGSGLVTSGATNGSSVITVASTGLTSASITINVADHISATPVTMAFDKDSYAPGELMTITISAAAADKADYQAFVADSLVPSVNIQTVTYSGAAALAGVGYAPTNGKVALVNGTATWKAYAPLSTGPLTITAKSSTTDTPSVSASTTVAADTTAADAAAEATDAANAATDAANAAAEAADAATAAAQDAADAVAALSAQVATLIAGLKAQLTALTNLVIKIQKKVKA